GIRGRMNNLRNNVEPQIMGIPDDLLGSMPGYVDNMRGMMKNVRESVGPQVQEMSDSIVDSMPGYFDQAKGLLDAIPAPAKEYFGSMP
ncbi:hypothetical protein TNCT_705191, partial [Trichonephila clavata]